MEEQESVKGVYISTYGCQMNVSDTERMHSLLEMSNYQEVNEPKDADLIIINSCSVREKPVHKVHSEVGRYRKMKESKPHLRIGVGGCVGQQEKKNLLKDIPALDFVFGPDNIDELPSLVQELRDTGERFSKAKFDHKSPYQIDTLIRNPKLSSFVNITKGCDNFCTFCVVPFTRGRERSRNADELIKDIKSLVSRGTKEVVLLGQNVNSYTSDCGVNFAQLLKKVAVETEIERIRYTTSHPKDFDQELCDVMQEHRDKICDYIHLPFQSGSTKILDRMNRIYTREEYFEKVKMIKKSIPGVSLSTDIIVGFPGETEEDFQGTLDLLEEAQFETIFAFKYSPRPFTKAARFDDQVDEHIKSQRLNKLFDFHNELAFKWAEKYVGNTLEVLVEAVNKKDPSKLTGRSTQNKLVHFKGDASLIGSNVQVFIERAQPSSLHGVLKK